MKHNNAPTDLHRPLSTANCRPTFGRCPPTADSPYRSLSGLAVASLILGVMSAVVFVDWLLAILPATAIVLAVLALRQIRSIGNECAGSGLARTGMALAIAFWIAGYGWLLHAQAKDVPYGYTAVSYYDLQADPQAGDKWVPSYAMTLEGKKVFVKGYMYPSRQQSALKGFVISRDNGTCPYCLPNPRPTDLIQVELTGDLRMNYTDRLLRIGGVLHVQPEPKVGQPPGPRLPSRGRLSKVLSRQSAVGSRQLGLLNKVRFFQAPPPIRRGGLAVLA